MTHAACWKSKVVNVIVTIQVGTSKAKNERQLLIIKQGLYSARALTIFANSESDVAAFH